MSRKNSYEIKPKMEIDVSKKVLWDFLIDLNGWWVKSNSDHDSLKVHHSGKPVGLNTKITVKEKIAGIPCKATGKITQFNDQQLVEWTANYYIWGLKWIKIDAGVRWKLTSIDDHKSTLMANVWADFPNRIGYRLLWFLFKYLMNGIKKDYDHAMKELTYIKKTVERENS